MSPPIREWTRAGAWAIADRALFSLSSFAVSLLLARWLSESAYGAFSMAFAVFLLAGGLHGGLLTEPMLVYGSGRLRDRFATYLGFLVRRQVAFGIVVTAAGLAIAATLAALGMKELSLVFVAGGIAAPWILLQWLGRLACYASVGPRRSALAGVAQLALVIGGLLALRASDTLTPVTAFLLLGLAGAAVGGMLIVSLRPVRVGADGIGFEAGELHRSYGRWAAGTAVLTWVPGQVYYLVLPLAGAVAAAGSLRALMNLVLPLMQVFVALSTVLTTALARLANSDRHARAVRLAGFGFLALAAAYALALTMFGAELLHWIYNGRYDANAGLLPLVAVLPVLGVGVTVFAPALRSLERPDRVFVAYLASTVVSLTLGLWITIEYGVVGSLLGLASTTITTSLVLWLAYRNAAKIDYPSGSVSTASPLGSTTTQSESL